MRYLLACMILSIAVPAQAQFEDNVQKSLEQQVRSELTKGLSFGVKLRIVPTIDSSGRIQLGIEPETDDSGKKSGGESNPDRDGGSGVGAPDPNPPEGDDESPDNPPVPLGPPGDEGGGQPGAPPAKKDGDGVVLWPLPKPPLPNIDDYRYPRWVAGKRTPPMSDWEFQQWQYTFEYDAFLREAEAEQRARWERFQEIRQTIWEQHDNHSTIKKLREELDRHENYVNQVAEDPNREQEFMQNREAWEATSRSLRENIEQARSITHDDRLTETQRENALREFFETRDIYGAYDYVSKNPYAKKRLGPRDPSVYDEIPDSQFTGRIYIIQDRTGPLSHAFALIQDPKSPDGYLRFEINGPGFDWTKAESWKGATVGSKKLNFTLTDVSKDDFFYWDDELKIDGGDYSTLIVPPHVQRRLLKQAWIMLEESKQEDWEYAAFIWSDTYKQCATVIRDWLWRGTVYLPDNTIAGIDNPMILPDAIDDYNNGFRSALPAGGWKNRAIKVAQYLLPGDSFIFDDPLQYYDEVWDTRINPVFPKDIDNPYIFPKSPPKWVRELLDPPQEITQVKIPLEPKILIDETSLVDDRVFGIDDEITDEIFRRAQEELAMRLLDELEDEFVIEPETPDKDPILFDRERDEGIDDPIPYAPVPGAPDRQTALDVYDPNAHKLLVPWPNQDFIAFVPTRFSNDELGNVIKKKIEDFSISIPEVSNAFPPRQMSGGQRTRNVARAIVNEPDLILLDEPFANESPIPFSFGIPRFDNCPINFSVDEFDSETLFTYSVGEEPTYRPIIIGEDALPKSYRLDGLPNDPLVDTEGETADEQWSLKKIGLLSEAVSATLAQQERSWNSVVVAVIDSGIDPVHPDLLGQLWINRQEIPFNGLDDDQNGYVDDVFGYNFLDNNGDIRDRVGHGTHVAGIIAAKWDDQGIAGIAPQCRVMVLKAFDENGETDSARIAMAIRYAVLQGADIIQISAENSSPDPVERTIYQWAIDSGVLVVASSGSQGKNTSQVTPASLPHILTVGAVDRSDNRASFSGWGQHLDLVAPGIDILSCRSGESDFMRTLTDQAAQSSINRVVQKHWYRADGTSFAAPQVAGIAARLWMLHPEWSADEIRHSILASCDDLEQPGWDPLTGAGRVNFERALSANPAHFVETKIDHAEITTTGGHQVLRIFGRAKGPGFVARTLQVAYGEKPAEEDWNDVVSNSIEVQDGPLGDITSLQLNKKGVWSLRSIVQSKSGSKCESRTSITIR